MRKAFNILGCLIFFTFSFFFILNSDVYACRFGYDSDCNDNPCPCPGGTAWCDSGGSCRYTCGNCPSVTPAPGKCNCDSWGPWTACSGGYQTHDCVTYSGPCPPPLLYQEQYCGPTPGGGGNTPTPGGGGNTPTPGGGSGATNTPTSAAPSCVISAAVLSPASSTIQVGDTTSFSLTVTDNPVGCTTGANFVLSNANASIISTNPDHDLPFTVTALCVTAGSVSITGQARYLGVVGASDTSAITCSAIPTVQPTVPPVPGQCANPSFSGSGACSGGNLNLNYSWGAIAGTSTYRWQLSSSSTFSSLIINSTGSGTSFSSTQVAGTYYARVRVETSSGSCAAPSPWSKVVIVSNFCGVTATPFPTGPTLTPTPLPPTATPTPPPVTISLTPITLNGVGATGLGYVSVSGGSITTSNFIISGVTGVATVSNGAIYQTTATALTIGTTEYTVVGTDTNGNVVTAHAPIQVINPQPWCQIKEGDVIAGGVNPSGNVSSPIPVSCSLNPSCDPNLIVYDTGDYPGVVAAGGAVNTGTGQSSQPQDFTVVSDKYSGNTYTYAYFDSKTAAVPFNILSSSSVSSAGTLTGGAVYPLPNGYHWNKYTGNLTIGGNIDLTTNKVVLFVDGDLNINGKINLTDGQGFFMAVVSGDINVNGLVGGPADTTPDLEGLYFADGNFNSGTLGPSLDQQLHVRGAVAVGGFNLQRGLPDNSAIPAEFFEFGPDQVIQFPSTISKKQVLWREVAP